MSLKLDKPLWFCFSPALFRLRAAGAEYLGELNFTYIVVLPNGYFEVRDKEI